MVSTEAMWMAATKEVCKFETFILARFRPTSAGAKCKTKAGAEKASYAECIGGAAEDKVYTGGAVEAEKVCTGG